MLRGKWTPFQHFPAIVIRAPGKIWVFSLSLNPKTERVTPCGPSSYGVLFVQDEVGGFFCDHNRRRIRIPAD